MLNLEETAVKKPTIYKELRRHQVKRHQDDEPWGYRDVMQELHEWADRFIVEFKLEIPEVTIGIDALRRRCNGQFQEGHNSLGLRREIIIARSHLEECLSEEKWFELQGTLLHELLHAWQEEHGKSGV